MNIYWYIAKQSESDGLVKYQTLSFFSFSLIKSFRVQLCAVEKYYVKEIWKNSIILVDV